MAVVGAKNDQTPEIRPSQIPQQPGTIAFYLTEAFQSGDADFICHALETIARAKGMTDFVSETGIGSGSAAKPEFETVRQAIASFGLKLVAEPIAREQLKPLGT